MTAVYAQLNPTGAGAIRFQRFAAGSSATPSRSGGSSASGQSAPGGQGRASLPPMISPPPPPAPAVAASRGLSGGFGSRCHPPLASPLTTELPQPTSTATATTTPTKASRRIQPLRRHASVVTSTERLDRDSSLGQPRRSASSTANR